MVALGFLAGIWTATRRCVKDGLDPHKVADLAPWLIVSGLFGARVLYVVTYWKDSFAGGPWWEVFMIQHGGLVFYGGLIGAIAATLVYVKVKKLPPFKLGDALAPSIALGYVFGRIGCLLNGCCYGKVCHLPWAITFPNQSPAWEQQFQAGLVGGHAPALPVHPTEVYDSLLNLVLYIGLAWLYRRKKFDGQVFATYLVCYAVTRSIVETFRGDYSSLHIHDGLTPAQLICIGIFVGGLSLFILLRRTQPQRV